MLQEMRKYTRSVIASIFMGALALSFVVWGIADVFRGNVSTDVYSVGSTAVPAAAFSREYQDAQRQAVPPGQTLTPDQQKQIGQSVLNEMMLRTALDRLANAYGLTASDARVAQQIQAITAFNGPLGTFDHDRFVQVLQQHGYNEKDFTERSRQDVARSQLVRAIDAGFALPADYPHAFFAYINEARAVDYVVVGSSTVPQPPAPSDAVLGAYVKAHAESFSTPEYRSVSYAGISLADVTSTIQVTDKQIQDEIDGDKADYVVPERRDLEQIKFANEADAKAAKAAIDGGKTFDAVAADHKLKDADYKLGSVTKDDLDPARQALFALPEGAVSAPIKSSFGWVLMRDAKITAGSAKSHDEVKTVLQKKLALSKMTDMANAYTDAIAGGASVQEAAQKAGMKFVHVAAIDAQGLAPDGTPALKPANPELLAAMFKAEVGDENSDPFQTQDGSFYAVKVDGITPPRPKPLDAVRAQALARWSAEQSVAALRVKAQQLAGRGNAEHSLAGVAASVGAPVQQTGPLMRSGKTEGIFTADVTKAIFAAPAGGVIAVRTKDNSYVVVRVTGIRHPLPPDNDMGYRAGVNQFSEEVGADVTLTLAKAVQKKDGTTINQKLVDGTIGGQGTAGQ
ncbi:MAG TPA: peptidyl-prolyl cis-trans isomerase [Rhizomicrobium sp.]|jgi:peptidyl-prolyl cis-trans isomerase D|nr:peptidyl-prolyl cis-trans isomerase [Rhizomicrobium sp.]